MIAAAVPEVPSPAVDVCTNVTAEQWDRYVDGRADASIYHRAAWAGVIERSFGHETQYLAARARGAIVGVLPLVLFKTPLFGRFATSMPFVNFGGIVADSSEAATALLSAGVAKARAEGASYLELRHARRMFPDLPVQTHKVEMVLALQPNVDDQWRVLDRKLRNQVRKAEKSALTVRTGRDELLDPFYDILARNMRDLGSPVHSKRFFASVLAALPERSRLFCVLIGSTPIAASFVIWNRDQVEVPWASAIRSYNPLCPNVFLYWEMLKFAIDRRMARFDFGRSTPHAGTYLFKQQWGAEPQQLYWEYWLSEGCQMPDRGPQNPRFSAAISTWQKLPVALTRVVGPYIVRNIP